MSSLARAERRLLPLGRSAGVIAGAEWMTAALTLLLGVWVQGELPAGKQELIRLPLWMLFAASAATPLQMHRSWIYAETAGILDADDLGFLRCSSNFWLWGRLLVLRLLTVSLLLLSVLPGMVLLTAAKVIWLRTPLAQDALFPLLTAAHVMLSGLAAFLLPVRVYAALLTLPYAFLKLPHLRVREIVGAAFAYSRGHTLRLVCRRLRYLPEMLFPVTAVKILPRICTAELIEAEYASRNVQPPGVLSVIIRTIRRICRKRRAKT